MKVTEKNTAGGNDCARLQLLRETVIKRLREKGCRITKQRLMLLDIILEEECSCCREIYHRARQRDESIGTATVYRLVNTLEEIGAVNRRRIYRILGEGGRPENEAHTVMLDDGTELRLSAGQWKRVVQAGLKECGFITSTAEDGERRIRSAAAGRCG